MSTKENQGGESPASACSAGDWVTWTHVNPRGRSIQLTTRRGRIDRRSTNKPECFLVKYRGKLIRIHESNLRKDGDRTHLTDMVMGPEQPNQKHEERANG